MKNVEEISATVVDAAFHLHRDLGPGLLESVYETVLARMLQDRGLVVIRQKPVSITFKEGVKRIVNNHQNLASSRLRVNQQ